MSHKELFPIYVLFFSSALFISACSDDDTVCDPVVVQQPQLFIESFRQDALPAAGFAGNTDALLVESLPSTNYGSDNTLSVGINHVDDALHSLIKFDIGGYFPASAEVVRAYLTLFVLDLGNELTVWAHPVTATWVESEASWLNASSLHAWDSPGGDFGERVMGSSEIPTPSSTFDIELAPDVVQSWIQSPGTNLGVILVPDSAATVDNFVILVSSESTNSTARPLLTVVYALD